VHLNPDDPTASAVGARVARRDVTGSSFWFAIDSPDDEEWTAPATRGGLPLRTLKRLRLIDVAPVTSPAYASASVVVADVGSPEAFTRRHAAEARIAVARRRTYERPPVGR
jgi:phage head maturation protease